MLILKFSIMVKHLMLYAAALTLCCCYRSPQQKLQPSTSFKGVFIKEQKIAGGQSRLLIKDSQGDVKEFFSSSSLIEPLVNFLSATGIHKVDVVYTEEFNPKSNKTERIIQRIMPVYELKR